MAAAAAPESIVLVLATQWRAQALGAAGDPNARTPRLDALAREGVWFAQAVTPHPFGVFARAAFLTGRRCPDNGVRDYYDPLPAGAATLATRFAKLGWETAHFGKWQLGLRDPRLPPLDEAHARRLVPPARRGGFAHWEGFESGFLLNDPLWHGDGVEGVVRLPGYQADVVVDRFLAYRQDCRSRRPLLAMLSLDPPHPPYGAPAGGVAPPDPQALQLPGNVPADADLRARVRCELAGYYAHIEATDRALGRLVDALRADGSWGRCLFVFASAHGDMHGANGCFRKGWPHEESARVPLIASWPERWPARRSEALVSLLDVGAAALRAAGGPDASADWDGEPLQRVVEEGAPGPARQRLSMPSVPPFALQCPYAWSAVRDAARTRVLTRRGRAYSLHRG